MKYVINDFCEEIHNGNYTFIINHDTGKYFKIRRNIWNNIMYYIENDMDVDGKLKDIFKFVLDNKLILPEVLSKNKSRFEIITIQLTSSCNLNCKHCCASEISSRGNMDFYTIQKILQFEPIVFNVSGGEPMLHPQFLEVSKLLRKKCKGKIVLTTNGTLINEENARELCKYYDQFDISIDGENKEEVERIRGINIYEKVENAVKVLKSLCDKKITLSMATVKTAQEVKLFTELNENLGTIPIIREMYINDKVEQNFEKIIPGGRKKYIELKRNEFADNTSVELYKCGLIKFQLFFDVLGNVYPCGGLAEDNFCLGNINDIDIEEFKIKKRDYIINLMLKKEKFSKCKQCMLRGFCWNCLSEIENYSRVKEVFEEYCYVSKRKWNNILNLK